MVTGKITLSVSTSRASTELNRRIKAFVLHSQKSKQLVASNESMGVYNYLQSTEKQWGEKLNKPPKP